jgi:TonB family protein
MQQLKSLLFIPMLFVCICSANAQTPANKSIPISADSLRKERQSLEKPDKDGIYQMAEKMPQFPGGEKALLEYIGHNLKYPRIAQRNGIQGRVIIRFVIDEEGKVKNVNVLRGLDADCDYEALRVITNLPNFIPAEQKGEKVSVYFTIPITFRLN